MRLEGRSVDHINWPLEETGDILFEADVIVDGPVGIRLKLYQYVEITADWLSPRATEPNTAACVPRQGPATRSRGGGKWQGHHECSSLKHSTKDLSMGDLGEYGFSV